MSLCIFSILPSIKFLVPSHIVMPFSDRHIYGSFCRYSYGCWGCLGWICDLHASAGVWTFFPLENGIHLAQSFHFYFFVCVEIHKIENLDALN